MNDGAPAVRHGVGSRLVFWLVPSVLFPLALPGELRALAVLAFDALLLALYVLDARSLARAPLVLERSSAPRVRVGAFCHYALGLENRGRGGLHVALEDDVDEAVRVTPAERRGFLAGHESWEIGATLRPRARGALTLGPVHVQLESRLGLARVARALGSTQELTVFPRARRSEAAESRRPLRGLGQLALGALRGPRSEHLATLRAYQPGDRPHDVDVRASAKHGRPIVRTYRSEHDEPLWIVLDVSRSMLRCCDDEQATPFMELAVQAAAELAEQALALGRRVGLCAFDVSLRVALAPSSGTEQTRSVLCALAALTPSSRPLDVDALYLSVAQRIRRRAQVVLISALNADVQTAELERLACTLGQKHTLSCVAVRERAEPTLAPLDGVPELYARAARFDLDEREQARWSTLERAGVAVLYYQPSDLPT